MTDITAVTREEQEEYGFAGTAVYPHPQAYKGTLKAVSINNDDSKIYGSPKPYQKDGPGSGVDDSDDYKKG